MQEIAQEPRTLRVFRRTTLSFRSLALRAESSRIPYHSTILPFDNLKLALPKSLTLSGTSLERISSVWNVIDGEPRGTRIIAFDRQIGIGKGSWRRSVIAVRTDADLSSALAFNSDMVIDSTGGWRILYRPKESLNMRVAGLTPIEELQAYLDSVMAGQTATS